jgi:hypothetical protein
MTDMGAKPTSTEAVQTPILAFEKGLPPPQVSE